MIKEDVIHILNKVIEDNKFSNMEMNYYFNLKKYTLSERAFVKNILNLTIKNLIYLDYIIDINTKNIAKKNIRQLLRLSLAQAFYTTSDVSGIVYEAVEIAKNVNVQQGKFVNAVLRKMINSRKEVDEKLWSKREYSTLYSYPTWLSDKIMIDWPERGTEIMKSLKKRSYLSVRINPKKISREEFLKRIDTVDTDILYVVEDIFYLSNYKVLEENIFKDDEVFIQDGASYIVAKNMKINDGDIVLDACSSPGGKSLAMLNMYNPKTLFSCDIHDHKIVYLEDLKEKYKLDNMTVLKKDATEFGSFMQEYFDEILLDVPCSGLGVLRRKPEKVYTLTSSNVKSLKKLQKKIFDNNLTYLKVGGTLVYSTCTITRNENTNNVRYFLEKHDNIQVEPLDIPTNVDVVYDEFGGAYINPISEFLDAFYIIKFKKIKE